MQFTQNQTVKLVAWLLIFTVLSQAVYTALYVAASEVPRGWIWGLEGLIFVFLIAVAGSALVQVRDYSLGFAAIFASALLNVIQVGIGLTQFGPFRQAAQDVEGMAAAAESVVALSFFVYNAAKVLLGMAAIVFGFAVAQTGRKLLGRLTVFLGASAVITNAVVMMLGRIDAVPSGASGVLATLFLAICLHKLRFEN